MIAQPAHVSEDLRESVLLLLDSIRKWKDSCLRKYSGQPATDCHDQLTYTTGWEPYIAVTEDEEALSFMKRCRDDVKEHFTSTGLWKHGYWRLQEAHHGTEHFELFLGCLFRLDPEDSVTKEHLLDAAEHFGNWCSDVPPWFDESTGLFRALHFGTDGVGGEAGSEWVDPSTGLVRSIQTEGSGSGDETITRINVPDHLRCVNICLIAYQMTDDRKYLDLASQHAGLWADAIVSSDVLPVGLLPSGPVYRVTDEIDRIYRNSVTKMVGRLDNPVELAENVLASGGINAFLALYTSTSEERFLAAAERLLDILVTRLDDPDAGVVADALRCYRRATGGKRYDGAIEGAVRSLTPFRVKEIGVDANSSRDARPAGVGKHRNMPIWYENGEPRRHSPVLLSVAAEITSDQDLARCAVDLARTYFELAVAHLPDGRDHGCAANTVSAIARGHGRENHAGMTTAVLDPIIERFHSRDNLASPNNTEQGRVSDAFRDTGNLPRSPER